MNDPIAFVGPWMRGRQALKESKAAGKRFIKRIARRASRIAGKVLCREYVARGGA